MKPRVFVPAIASGVLLWLAFFPCDLGPLGFVALVPWLTLVRAPVSGWRRYLAAYLGGFTFFALATQWVRVAHPMMYGSWFGLAVVMPLFWLAALAVLRKLDALKLPLAVSVPVAWVAFEFFRMHFPTGFTFMKHVGAYQMIGFGWYFLGYTQHAFTPLIQIADVGGVYAVSFVVGAVNGAVAELVLRFCVRPAPQPVGGSPISPSPSWKKVGGGLAFALALFGVGLGYGFWQLNHAPFGDGPKVSAVQGNLTQDDKMDDPNGLLQSYSDLHYQAIQYDRAENRFLRRPAGPGRVAGNVLPGGLVRRGAGRVPRGLRAGVPAAPRELAGLVPEPAMGHERVVRAERPRVGRRPRVEVQLGVTGEAARARPSLETGRPADRVQRRRRAVRQDAPRALRRVRAVGGRVAVHERFTPYKHDYACRPGERWTRFPLTARDGRKFTFGCLICYEDSDPYLARQYAASEPVDFLVNISNDGWFKGTEEHEQHLAICRFRAVEARRAVVRSVNMGISGFIDSDGRIVKLPADRWSDSKKVDAIVTAVVPIDARGSPYATFGDWVPAGCWLLALVGGAVGLVRRKVV